MASNMLDQVKEFVFTHTKKLLTTVQTIESKIDQVHEDHERIVASSRMHNDMFELRSKEISIYSRTVLSYKKKYDGIEKELSDIKQLLTIISNKQDNMVCNSCGTNMQARRNEPRPKEEGESSTPTTNSETGEDISVDIQDRTLSSSEEDGEATSSKRKRRRPKKNVLAITKRGIKKTWMNVATNSRRCQAQLGGVVAVDEMVQTMVPTKTGECQSHVTSQESSCQAVVASQEVSSQADPSRYMLPIEISNMVGKPIEGRKSYGPLESFSCNGIWNFKKRSCYSQEEIDKCWSFILKGERSSVHGAPIILPSFMKYLIGNFCFVGYYQNYMRVYFCCYPIKYNESIKNEFPLEFDLKIKINDEGFEKIKVIKFQIKQIGCNYSQDLIPIHGNWSKNRQPKVVELSII